MEANDRQTGYVLGRMQYAPTCTDQKFDSYLLDESETWQVFRCMSLRPTSPQRGTIKICTGARETRQGLDGYDQYYANLDEQLLKIVWMHTKPGEDWMNMAIFTENPPGMGRIWPYSLKTRRGWDEYGHSYRKPGGDGRNMAIFTENPPRMERIWPYSLETRRGLDEYGHIRWKPGEDEMNMAISIENPPGIG